jgi:hypothetical protein
MKQLLTLALVALFLCACGAAGAGEPKLDVKVGGKDSTLNVKSGAVYPSEMVFTAPGKPDVKTSAHTIYLTNYEMDTTGPGWMNKPLTAPEQIRVGIQLTGEGGTAKDSPFKVGTYSAQADKVNGVRFVKVSAFADGKQTDTTFNSLMGLGDQKASGEVKISSVTADAVSGEVNLTEGDKSIKGAFTAKLPQKK